MPSLYYKTEGIVLKKMPFKESDFLVRLYTKNFGKIDVLAKGARKSQAKLNTHIDMANLIRMSFVKNGERIPTLTDAETIDRFDDWFEDVERITLLGKIIKTLDLMLASEQEDPLFFKFLVDFIKDVPNADNCKKRGGFFLEDILEREGYSRKPDLSSLPQDIAESIMKLWHELG